MAVTPIGKYGLQGGSWENHDPFDLVSEFNHALAICLNAVYAGQVEVSWQENIASEQVMFNAKLAKGAAHSTYIGNVESLFGETGWGFRKILNGMCLTLDDSKIIFEYKLPKSINLKYDPDDQMSVFPDATPVENSWKKLVECGAVNALSEALDARHSIKFINYGDIAKAIKDLSNAVNKMQSELSKTKTTAIIAEKNMTALGEKMIPHDGGFAKGGFVPAGVYTWPPSGAGYNDSGKILKEKFPGLNEIVKFPCKCELPPDTIHNIIMHLNDFDGHGSVTLNKEGKASYKKPAWTREQIADWLETLDVKLELKEN